MIEQKESDLNKRTSKIQNNYFVQDETLLSSTVSSAGYLKLS